MSIFKNNFHYESNGNSFSFPKESNRLSVLKNDLNEVSKRIAQIKNEIEEQTKLYQTLKETLKGKETSKHERKKQYEKIERTILALEDERKELEDFQQEVMQRIATVQPSDKKHFERPFRKTLLNIIYPATTRYSPEALQSKELNWTQKMTLRDQVIVYEDGSAVINPFDSEVKQGKAKRIAFYTDDHYKLDGCIVYGNIDEHHLKNRKIMMMALGNGFTWHQGYLHAQLMAQIFDCNVLLYNPRGIGKSSGSIRYMQDAVEDCKAAIAYALKKACTDERSGQINAQQLCVYGHSLGGAISAIALEELVKEGKIDAEGVGLYINHHSFSSLSGFVKGIGKILERPSRLFLAIANHNELKAKKAIMETKLATRVIVATGEKDTLMRKLSRLEQTLRDEEVRGVSLANQVTYISIPDYGHHQEEEYLLDYEAMMINSTEEAIQSLGTSNSKKLKQLATYHQIIEEWAKS